MGLFNFIGISPAVAYGNVRGMGWYVKDYFRLKKQLEGNSYFKISKMFPILRDKHDASGIISGHYFHQDLLVAQKIFKNNPERHIDVGSRTDGFVAHVASFRKIEVIDIRPLDSKINNISFLQADFMKSDEVPLEITDSISCLHAIEHFGLGRYNDPIDANGHLKGLDSIYRVLKANGKFYFSTPIGPQRIEFNAHRVFSIRYLLSLFKEKYVVDSFSYVDDKGSLHQNVDLNDSSVENNFNCVYGCGIFELTKI